MNTIGHSGKRQNAGQVEVRSFRRLPIAHAIALMLATGSVWGDAHAQQAFSAAWYAQKGAVQAAAAATGKLPNGMPAVPVSSPLMQQQQANVQLQRSLANLSAAARSIALQQAQQGADRLAASAAASNIPNGLGVGGLNAGSLVNSWINANGPTQSTANGQTIVDIKQTADKAILNWETFNIGKNTVLQFDQQADWSVLNRVNNATAPSVIQGQIKAPGTVMIVNANGIVFTGTSQVNTRNLVAAAVGLSNEQFNKGLYSEKIGNNDIPTFGNAVNSATGIADMANAFGVVVEAGAAITTHQTTSATQGGGYVLMVGGQVSNAGSINTANGQTTLAAGDSFIIKKGVGTAGNAASTTRGNEVTTLNNAGSNNGKIINTGIVTASTGDITMAGHQIEQRGVLVSTTSVDTRGTIHLQNNPTDTTASITLGKDSLSAIVLDASAKTALDSQKNGLTGPAVDATGNIVPVSDRRDLSRIEITGGSVDFEGDSLTLATGGQVVVDAKNRTLVRDGAQIDVSGAVGVQLGMASNSLLINVQGNEQRDAAINRDGKTLNNNDIWIDKRDLILVKADYDAVKNPNGYKTDRWYTAGGLLEVAGYLATSGHSVGEWMAQGGIVNFTGNSVVTQAGSNINLSGGTIDVQTGLIKQTFLKGADGKLYNASTAPGDLLYTGVYKGYEDKSERWGDKATKYYYNALIAPRERLVNGYTVGRDAGTLVIGTANAVLEGKISSDVYQGPQQVKAPQANLDAYYQSHNAAAQHAQLIVGSISNFYDKTTGMLSRRIDAGGIKNVVFSDIDNQIAAGLDLSTVLPADRTNTLILNTEQLNGFGLGSIKIAAVDKIDVNGDLKVNAAGNITLYSNNVNVNANLTAHSGNIQLGNMLDQITTNGVIGGLVSPGNPNGQVTLAQGVKVDASGIWSNLLLDPNNTANLPYVNGGTVSIRSSQNATLNSGSSIDVSSGAALLHKGAQQAGKGGNVTLEANANGGSNGVLTLNGTLAGYGVAGGGTLTLQTNQILIGDAAGAAPDTLVLDGGYFNKGFSNYNIIGNKGVTVADGTQVDVTMPVYRFAQNANAATGGSNISDALELWTPTMYQEDAAKGVLTQRKGASIQLQAGEINSTAEQLEATVLTVGQGAVINVDPGQAIGLRSVGQLNMDGTLNAWGGSVTLGALSVEASKVVNALGHGRSIWVGEHALIDVAARAMTAQDSRGRRYGLVRDGGTISIGGTLDLATGVATGSDLFVVVREGARLDASGAQAMLDIAGQGVTNVASNGGSISLVSNNGLYLDGSFVAKAGGSGAAGGSLVIALESPNYDRYTAVDQVLKGRELLLSQIQQRHNLASTPEDAASSLQYGHGRLGMDQVSAGGFDNLALLSNGIMGFDGDVSLSMGQSLRLFASAFVLSENAAANSKVNLSAPYLLLNGISTPGLDPYVRPVIELPTVSLLPTEAQFNVSGKLIDARGSVLFGVKGGLSQADWSSLEFERRGFDQVNLSSEGDLRFLAGSNENGVATGVSTQLLTQGDMTLRAAQLYPATQVGARVIAGYLGGAGLTDVLFDPLRTLTIGRTGTTDAAMPYSAFGRLHLGAATVLQGGVVRAPLGLIDIGGMGSELVQLLPDSITSVSGKGLVLPYGGTLDGQEYRYNGQKVTFIGQGGVLNANSDLSVGVILGGARVAVQPNATLDLSGGGELLGAGFVSGRGGSTDARYNPLMQIGVNGGFVMPGLSTNPIYAIVPGVQAGVAPVAAEGGAVSPLIGQQVTIGAGVPGLPAGTYTLMPSTYALMPGAFRLEINGLAGAGMAGGAQPMRNGSWSAAGHLFIANTTISNSVASQLILTSADTLRRYSQYNETSYAQFARADAARIGVPRPMLEVDAKTLKLAVRQGAGADALSFEGIARFDAAQGGYGGTVAVLDQSMLGIEVVGAGKSATADYEGITLRADTLNALGAARLLVGGMTVVEYGQAGNFINLASGQNAANSTITLRDGATLAAPEVFLVSDTAAIVLEQGASINTLGRGKASFDARDGFIYHVVNMLGVSNGLINVVSAPALGGQISQGISIGACSSGACSGETGLYSDGSIVALTNSTFQLGEQVRFGTRHLNLGVNAINMGSAEALAAADAAQRLPAGLTLSQALLDRLLSGDHQLGAPALETLQLSARDGFNFYGNASLNTYDPVTGKSLLSNLMLSTPAMYGAGGADDVATINTANLIWLGATNAPGAVIAGGAGTGSGRLDINAERIEFGYGEFGQPNNVKSYDRLALGFANVNLNASERITANHKGSLSVYQSQDGYDPVRGFQYSGGNLTIRTPLMTGAAGSVNRITAGGAMDIIASAGPRGTTSGQGAELALQGDSIRLASAVVLPSGKVSVSARGDVVLSDEALIDVAGRAIAFNDVTQYGWGGDVLLESRGGNILQAAGSTIDLSAQHNEAGKLRAVATDAAAGMVDLQGKILGSSSGYHMASGTSIPYQSATLELQAQSLGGSGALDQQFADLNQRLNQGAVFGARNFQLKQGDLTIGNGLKAGSISVSMDNGSLRVSGLVDASGERVGSITLAGKHGMTLDGAAVLDAHGSKLRIDSYGKIIDAPNRAIVMLGSGTGLLTLADGARIDLRHGTDAGAVNDGRNRGTLELNAPRIINQDGSSDDVAIDARGHLNIQGARAITLNGMATYDDAPEKTDATASGRPYQEITQGYLDGKHALSEAFITAAMQNTNFLQNKLAGLHNATYADAFHLRPGVEIVSKTTDGDLVVQGDLDLSRYRYASLNLNSQRSNNVYGSGEPGSLILRAGGDLNIYGSINDGFAPPPPSADDKGWVLLPGVDYRGGTTVVPGNNVTLADGTAFPAGATLNYDLPIKGLTVAADTRLPVVATLDQDLVLRSGSVVAADVRDAGGNLLFAAGTLLREEQTLMAGTQLGAGTLLTEGTLLQGMIWPKGVPLPAIHQANLSNNIVLLDGIKALPKGALIPAGTDVKLPAGVKSVQLRDGISGSVGQLWAMSTMLTEGTQSWSLRLVAGADTEAADSRLLQARPRSGDIHLADSHYGMFAKALPPRGIETWTPAAVTYLAGSGVNVTAGDPIDQNVLDGLNKGTIDDFCGASPEYCKTTGAYTVTQTTVRLFASRGITVALGADLTDELFARINYPAVSVVCTSASGPSFCQIKNPLVYAAAPASTRFSVIRTGTGDLDLLSAGNLSMDSLYGVYTAGTSSTGTYQGDPYNQPKAKLGGAAQAVKTVLSDTNSLFEQFVDGSSTSLYRAWYPEAGGNLTINVGANLTGDITSFASSSSGRPNSRDGGIDSANVGNWLWRQGSGDVATGGQAQATAWWINFGSFTAAVGADKMLGFTGFGTLGGGNLDVRVGGDAGVLNTLAYGLSNAALNPHSQGLILAVGSTGRVASDGSLQLTGGGDLRVRIGGSLNPASMLVDTQDHRDGMLVNLRGDVQLRSTTVGSVDLLYGSTSAVHSPGETRAFDPLVATRGIARGGLTLVPGDATFNVQTMVDLVVKNVEDPGRVTLNHFSPFAQGTTLGTGTSWFTLWTKATAIDLFSLGGNLTPFSLSDTPTDLAVVYPSIVRATAAGGSLYYGKAAEQQANSDTNFTYPLLLAPGQNGQLQFLAQGSIYAGGMAVSQSGAAESAMATPWNPAYQGSIGNAVVTSNLSTSGNFVTRALFAFGPGSATASTAGSAEPARFYAMDGDLVGVSSGRIVGFKSLPGELHEGEIWYEGNGAVWMKAGRDIVSSGRMFGLENNRSITAPIDSLFVHKNSNDISVVSAGRDILYSNFQVAGPGLLEVSAGRNILMTGSGGEHSVTSLGGVLAGDNRPGASIVMQAGIGAIGPDYQRFIDAYLNPVNQAQIGESLQGNKVAKTYESELVIWLAEHFGFVGDGEQARAYYAALPAEQQHVFARDVYFAELKAAGREYNQEGGVRQGSYLRGRVAIAALFPGKDAAGNPLTYQGDITLFNGSGVHTDSGGSIQMLTPGGSQTFGIEGEAPPSTAGVITQGAGDIAIYSLGSILLGQSRIMTTFGGGIQSWSAEGDINAGRGSKTTVVYTPPKRVYDQWGNVVLSPVVPSTGAGIATLAPIAEVPAGDIDLIAPLGTIDAGEAGIRVSGNVNIAALQVMNAANIKVAGDAKGIPMIAAVNVGALTNASAAASSAAAAAQDVVQRDRSEARKNLPSIFTVRVLGFGNEDGSDSTPQRNETSKDTSAAYDAKNLVQVVGLGKNFSVKQLERLTEDERQRLLKDK